VLQPNFGNIEADQVGAGVEHDDQAVSCHAMVRLRSVFVVGLWDCRLELYFCSILSFTLNYPFRFHLSL
jgi:hypothetical protein